MTGLTLQVQGAAPAELVWLRYAEPARWAQWSPQVRRVEASAARIACGVTGFVVGPLGVRASFVIDEVDEADPAYRSWVWRVRSGPARLRLAHAVEPRPDGAWTSLTIDGPAPYVVAYAPLARLALTRLVRP